MNNKVEIKYNILGTGENVSVFTFDEPTEEENEEKFNEAIAAWNRRGCVKQNGETLDTNSVASNPLNAKLTYAAALGVERSGE